LLGVVAHYLDANY
jgi:hypothetical protein